MDEWGEGRLVGVEGLFLFLSSPFFLPFLLSFSVPIFLSPFPFLFLFCQPRFTLLSFPPSLLLSSPPLPLFLFSLSLSTYSDIWCLIFLSSISCVLTFIFIHLLFVSFLPFLHSVSSSIFPFALLLYSSFLPIRYFPFCLLSFLQFFISLSTLSTSFASHTFPSLSSFFL